MPRYFFHVSDGRRVLTDTTGREFAGLRAARTHAVAALREARGRLCERALRDLSDWSMRVTDEGGRIVFTLGFDLRIADVPLASDGAGEPRAPARRTRTDAGRS
jgi:hypothetical protein